MNIEEIRTFALSLTDSTESFPFGESVLVFKVKGKIFLLLPLDEIQTQFNVKCDPEKAIELREEYPDTILPGYHMNKKHWNTVIVDGKLNSATLKQMIEDSFCLVGGGGRRS
jgi:predicted DNA-binding protein (MmcQ/YjbR family)